jgi:hypothetical protein
MLAECQLGHLGRIGLCKGKGRVRDPFNPGDAIKANPSA